MRDLRAFLYVVGTTEAPDTSADEAQRDAELTEFLHRATYRAAVNIANDMRSRFDCGTCQKRDCYDCPFNAMQLVVMQLAQSSGTALN